MADQSMIGLVFGEMVAALKVLDTEEEQRRVVRALHIAYFGREATAPAETAPKPVKPIVHSGVRSKYPSPGLIELARRARVSVVTMRRALTEGRPGTSPSRGRAVRYLKSLGLGRMP